MKRGQENVAEHSLTYKAPLPTWNVATAIFSQVAFDLSVVLFIYFVCEIVEEKLS